MEARRRDLWVHPPTIESVTRIYDDECFDALQIADHTPEGRKRNLATMAWRTAARDRDRRNIPRHAAAPKAAPKAAHPLHHNSEAT